MNANKKKSESKLISKYNLVFSNVKKDPAIGEQLSAAGYNEEALAEGKKLLENTEAYVKDSRARRILLSEKSVVLHSKQEALANSFKRHRKLARIAYRLNKVVLDKLSISGKFPRNYTPLVGSASNFYDVLSTSPDLLAKLSRYSITEEKVQEGLHLVDEVVNAYSDYMYHLAEAQKITKVKQYAFDKINKWMRDFYDAARVAFIDEPQQLEAFGVVVRS